MNKPINQVQTGGLASAGFGHGIAIPVGDSGNGRGRGSAKQGGFADVSTPGPETPKARSTTTDASATQLVEILFKPDPVCTGSR